ncbi:MAG TPA: hypothetical protein VHS09_10480 [Polyangiaceae bacterium]|jgi:hypothetical protein|nr:hypothetical protein [Polyangiaceae bacterium]
MKIRMLLWSGLSASAIVLAGGAALSGGATTSNNLLVDYDQKTHQLSAYPAGAALTTYLHQPTTVHLAGNLTKFAPPDPCRPIAELWNLTVQDDERFGVTSTFIFDALLTIMSDLQCHATVTSTTGAPQPITFIAPSEK